MNAFTRFAAKPNRGHGNVTGADNVVAWRTGYPFGVNHSRGYPRFNPGEYTTSDTLARGEADCGMMIACDPMANFSQPAREHLASIPFIALDAKETPTTRAAAVAFTVATYGINTGARSTGWTTSRSRCARLRVAPPERLGSAQQIEKRVKNCGVLS